MTIAELISLKLVALLGVSDQVQTVELNERLRAC